MRFQIFTALFLCTLFTSCTSAKKDVPMAVQKTFGKKYPGGNDPDWHKDNNGNFEADFKMDGKSLRVDFSPDGSWLETEQSIKKEDLPQMVKDRLEDDFDGEAITGIEEVDHHGKGRFYDVEFKRKGKNKDVGIKENGTIINWIWNIDRVASFNI